MPTFEIGKITVQPDKLLRLEGDNNYDLISLKRAIVTGYAGEGDKLGPFKLVLDFRARLMTVEAKNCPVSAWDIAAYLQVKHVRMAPHEERMPFLVGEGQKGDLSIICSFEDPDYVLGFLHRLREEGKFSVS